MTIKVKDWLSLKEASDLYKVPVSYLTELCTLGSIPSEKRGKGKKWMINMTELLRLVEIRELIEEETRTPEFRKKVETNKDGLFYYDEYFQDNDE